MKANQETSRRMAGDVPQAYNFNPMSFWADLSRKHLAMVNESASALCRGREAIHTIQQEAAHRASAHHAEIAEKLQGSCEPADLQAIKSQWLNVDFPGISQYWQQIAAAALQTQIEMMASTNHIFGNGADGGATSALEAFQALMSRMPTSNTLAPTSEGGYEHANAHGSH